MKINNKIVVNRKSKWNRIAFMVSFLRKIDCLIRFDNENIISIRILTIREIAKEQPRQQMEDGEWKEWTANNQRWKLLFVFAFSLFNSARGSFTLFDDNYHRHHKMILLTFETRTLLFRCYGHNSPFSKRTLLTKKPI